MTMRIPPSTGRFTDRDVPIYAFIKHEGSVSSTFVGRIIRRVPIRLTLQDGGEIDAVRYAGRFWPIYKAETFSQISRQWVGERDTVIGDDQKRLKLPMKHQYLFECDAPRSFYD